MEETKRPYYADEDDGNGESGGAEIGKDVVGCCPLSPLPRPRPGDSAKTTTLYPRNSDYYRSARRSFSHYRQPERD